jgi:zinc transporter ZupT
MFKNKTAVLLFGVAAGIALAAAVMGLFLVGVAIGSDLQADTTSVPTQHPLFVPGVELISTSLLAGIPLLTSWYLWRKHEAR